MIRQRFKINHEDHSRNESRSPVIDKIENLYEFVREEGAVDKKSELQQKN